MAQTIVSSPFTDNRMTLTVSHTSHGFDANDIGKAVRSSGTDGQFVVARANTAANAEVVGVITSIDTANQYTITTSGFVDVVAAVPTATAGTVYFLAEADDSQLTSTEPTTAGAVSKPVAVVTESNAQMILIHYRGEVITSAVVANAPNDANYLIGTANSSLSAEIVVGTAPGGELGGTWASPTVDSTHSGSAHHAEAHTVVSHSDTTATGAELETLTDGSTTALHVHTIADDSIVEAKLDVSNGPTNGQFLQAQSGEGGGLTWAAAGVSSKTYEESRTASAGSGNQDFTNAGFAPKAAIILALEEGTQSSTIGLLDSGTNGGVGIYAQTQSSYPNIWNEHATGFQVRDAGDIMDCTPSLLANGIRFAWTKYSNGMDVNLRFILIG